VTDWVFVIADFLFLEEEPPPGRASDPRHVVVPGEQRNHKLGRVLISAGRIFFSHEEAGSIPLLSYDDFNRNAAFLMVLASGREGALAAFP